MERISQYIYLDSNNPIWSCDVAQFREVLNSVAYEFHYLSKDFPNKLVYVTPSIDGIMDCPMCCYGQEYNTIFLRARSNRWSQYIYQFSHEYCHHLVGGPLDGKLEGSFWFEETICELASIYMLRAINRNWNNSMALNHFLRLYNPCHIQYVNEIIERPSNVINTNLSKWINERLTILESPAHQREMYTTMAVNMLYIFEKYPLVWGILPYLTRKTGDGYLNFQNYLNNIDNELPELLRVPFAELKLVLLGR